MTVLNLRRPNFRTLSVALATAVLTLLGLTVIVAMPAYAGTGNIQAPFDIGQTWYICQGYNQPNVTHHDNGPYATNPRSKYGLDLSGEPGCGNAASGWNVRAPLGGTVSYSSGSGSLCINTTDNRSITLTHIVASVTSGAVSAGQIVGTVAAPGAKSNGGVAHIHLQMWSSPGCWGTGNGGIPFDSEHNSRICGAPDLVSGGAGSNGEWSGTSLVGASCTTASTSDRIGTLSADGTLFVKEGAIDAGWVTMEGSVIQFALAGNRVGILKSDGTFLLKEGTLSSGWITMQGGVSRISLSGDRIGIVTNNGEVYVKEGGVSAPWVLLYGSTTDIALSGNRIAILDAAGTLRIKEGTIYSGWVTLQGGVSKMSVSPARIGTVLTNGDVQVKDGSIYSGWVTLYGGSTDVSLTDNRIGVLDSSGTLRIKEGSIYNGWTVLQGAVSKISFSSNRIGIILTNGNADVKEGTVNDPWVTVNGPMVNIKLN